MRWNAEQKATRTLEASGSLKLRVTMLPIYVLSALLIAASIALVVSHVVSWNRAKENAELDDTERAFAWNQFRRRVQASGMIGLLGVGIAAHRLVPLKGFAVTLYVGALTLITLWVLLLALADMAATRIHFGRMMRRLNAENRAAANELVAAKKADDRKLSNGHHAPED